MSKWSEKINLAILLTSLAVLIFIAIIFFGYKNNKFDFLINKNKSETVSEEEKISQADYTEIARKTLDWIDEQRDKDGWYILERGCESDEKSCNMVFNFNVGNKDGLIATWARLNFFEQHGDPKDLEIVKKDIDIFYNKYRDDDLKDSLWICKITYEMAQSKYISEEQKDKLKELCLNINLPVLSFSSFIEDDFFIFKNLSNQDTIIDKNNSTLTVLSGLAHQNFWFNKNYQFSEYYNDLIKIIDEDYRGVRNINNACLVLYSVVDWYGIRPNETLFNSYKKWRLGINNKYIDGGDSSVICGLLDKKLYNLSKDISYSESLQKVKKTIIDNDSLDYGNGFFLFNQMSQGVLIKNVIENALIVELIRK